MSTLDLPRQRVLPAAAASAAPARPPLRVLVLEGNPVPRAILGRLLARADHDVTAVESVAQATAAVHAARYDVIFTGLATCGPDLQALVRAVRASEAGDRADGMRTPRTAIVGLGTAGGTDPAARADANGLDAVLALPIEPQHLNAVLETLRGRVRPGVDGPAARADGASRAAADGTVRSASTPAAARSASTPAANGAARSADAPGAFTIEAFTAQFGTDHALVARLAAVFTTNARKLLELLDRSLQASDAPMIGAAAHSLKGSLAMLGAQRAAAAAQRLESAAVAGALAAVGPLAAVLRDELDQVVRTLSAAASPPPAVRPPSPGTVS